MFAALLNIKWSIDVRLSRSRSSKLNKDYDSKSVITQCHHKICSWRKPRTTFYYDKNKIYSSFFFVKLMHQFERYLNKTYDSFDLQFSFELEFDFWSASFWANFSRNLFKIYSQYLARIVSCVEMSWLHKSATFSSSCFGSSSIFSSVQSKRRSWYKSTKNAIKNGDRTPESYSSSQKSTTCCEYDRERKKSKKNR